MEMKVTLREVLSRVSLRAPEAPSEKVRLHNVTLMPARGARVVVADRRATRERTTTEVSARTDAFKDLGVAS
jgi:hypothetical protein